MFKTLIKSTVLLSHHFPRSNITVLLNCCRSCQTTTFTNVNTFTERSHTCGQLNDNDIGKRVTLFGWIKHTRYDNKIITLRDSYGETQCIVDKSLLTKSFRKTNLYNESVIQVSGIVQRRILDQPSTEQFQEKVYEPKQSPDGIEILVDSFKVLALAKGDLPILTRDSREQTLSNRLTYRYLDLRSSRMQEALRFRSKITNILRNTLCNLNFIECETPTLFKRTPGGANEFIVPTQLPDKFYSLTQSPQQLKQLLMIGSLDRYFQISRCYRDESGRSDRQPEFTQLDIELSFTNQHLIIELVNRILYELFSQISLTEDRFKALLTSCFEPDGHVKILTHKEAFLKFGTDKPDARFASTIQTQGDSGYLVDVPFKLHEHDILQMVERLIEERNLNISRDRVRITHDGPQSCNTKIYVDDGSIQAIILLGALRLRIAEKLNQSGLDIYQSNYSLMWVVDFPLFSIDDETGRLESNHHPFTAPTEDTVKYLATDPLRVIGQHYDLVLNGQEIAGGSMRINDADLQDKIFTSVLKCNKEDFSYFIEALRSGCPPHGGIAFGLDRLVAILLGRDSIRDVIAFPKSSIGRDLMSDCPHDLDGETRKLYHLK